MIAADTPVLTQTGWKAIGSIRELEQVFRPRSGFETPGHHPRKIVHEGEYEAYRVTFNDDTSLVCSACHSLYVTTPSRRRRGKGFTREHVEVVASEPARDKAGNRKWFVALVEPPKFPEASLPVHPYLLGYLLGNGWLSGDSPGVTAPEAETVDLLKTLLPEGVFAKPRPPKPGKEVIDYRLTSDDEGECANLLAYELERLGLMGHTADTKWVPDPYLFASFEQRLDCLRGLMDSDGTPTASAAEFSSSSERLARGVIELGRSLGGTATYRTAENWDGDRRLKDRHYAAVALPAGLCPFLLSTKAGKYTGRTKKPPSRSIESVEPCGRVPMVSSGPVVAAGYVVA